MIGNTQEFCLFRSSIQNPSKMRSLLPFHNLKIQKLKFPDSWNFNSTLLSVET